jgi:predicted glycogen debranching enzyme
VRSQFEQDEREWLEADGLGGFASGTVNGIRTRRYHGLLVVATRPPTGRMVLVNGFDAWLETARGRVALSSQRYAPGVVHPDGAARIEAFDRTPWPTWTFRLEDDTRVRHELFVCHDRAATVMTWRLVEPSVVKGRHRADLRLLVRLFLSGRDYHATHHENGSCRTSARLADGLVLWQPYDDVPGVLSQSNARYEHDPDWYRRFLYTAERERGLDDTEDLFAPGWLSWDLSTSEAMWVVSATTGAAEDAGEATAIVEQLREQERTRRASFRSPLHHAADAYLVRRGAGKTIVAGYPWFTDWGRDTFIALRGLCLATERFDEARDILLAWSRFVSEGMLPNRFLDDGEQPEFNAVDASLWFIVAVQDFCDTARGSRARLSTMDRAILLQAVDRILDGYARGTRYGIRMDADGLLPCGVPGVQLTWMDAKVGDWVVTPRIGKPVEVQALWLNALRFARRELASHTAHEGRWTAIYERGRRSFADRFWYEAGGYLYDVVDVDHQAGRVDATLRPNQIFAVGALPDMLIDGDRARRVLDVVEQRLLTPLGLRSLAPGEQGYVAHYRGGPVERDAAYHQGTVWPWLLGGFVQAWLALRGNTAEARLEARERFLPPLIAHLEAAGLGHVSEITDAEPPFTPRGCPFQAWSMGELLRIQVLLETAAR